MVDELQRLGDSPELFQLLTHYAELVAGDRQVWQDRLMEMPGITSRDLVKLHGELLAFEWIEQNTGTAQLLMPGLVPSCYRITAAGLRALKQAQADPEEQETFEDGMILAFTRPEMTPRSQHS